MPKSYLTWSGLLLLATLVTPAEPNENRAVDGPRPCPQDSCYFGSAGELLFWTKYVEEADAAITGYPPVAQRQQEYNDWVRTLPELQVLGTWIRNKQQLLIGEPSDALSQSTDPLSFAMPRHIEPTGSFNRRTLMIPQYRCRWRLLALLAALEREAKPALLDFNQLVDTYQRRGGLGDHFQRDEHARRAVAIVEAFKETMRYSGRLKALSGQKWPSRGNIPLDHLEPDLFPKGALADLENVQLEMEAATALAEEFALAHEARSR